MSKEDFIKILHEHDFTYEQFIDLRDEWDRLSWQDRYDLLKEDLKKEATDTCSNCQEFDCYGCEHLWLKNQI